MPLHVWYACDLTTFIYFIDVLFIIGCLFSYLQNADAVLGAGYPIHYRCILTPFPRSKQCGVTEDSSTLSPFSHVDTRVKGKQLDLAVAVGAEAQDHHTTDLQRSLLCQTPVRLWKCHS